MNQTIRPASRSRHVFSVILVAAQFGLSAPITQAADASAVVPGSRELSLEQCLDAALQNNHPRPASRFAVAAAEAQHQQTFHPQDIDSVRRLFARQRQLQSPEKP